MSSASQPDLARASVSFPALLYGAAVAPLFWLGQLILGYAVTAFACFPGDHPVPLAWARLGTVLTAFNSVAILAATSGGLVALWCLRQVRRDNRPDIAATIPQGRARFIALWGIFSSLWFFCAILFNTIAAVTVPPCLI